MAHENVVRLEEIVTSCARDGEDSSSSNTNVPSSIYMVFEYCDGDLLDVLKRVRDGRMHLTKDHLRCFTKQLLDGLHYIHTNHILHRDIKAANILVTRDCRLKIADWGLGRTWRPPPHAAPTAADDHEAVRGTSGGSGGGEKPARYTDNVVTLWYRAPELLMGVSNYTAAIDLWSIGCLIAELFLVRTLFQGRDELEQLNMIFNVCGTPTPDTWPTIPPRDPSFRPHYTARPRRLRQELGGSPAGAGGADLVDKLLALDPTRRWTAEQALDHDYFWGPGVESKSPYELPPLNLPRRGGAIK